MSRQNPFTENIEMDTYGYTRLDQGTILSCLLQKEKEKGNPQLTTKQMTPTLTLTLTLTLTSTQNPKH